jgi:hypothetical protein
MPWKLEQIPRLTGYTVEWAEPDDYYLSRRNQIYHSADLEDAVVEVGSIDAPLWRRVASRSRLCQRLLRFMVYNLIPLSNGDLFITFDKTIGIFRDGRYIHVEGLVRPCRVLRSGCAVNAAGDVFFGEYLANPGRDSVHIYRYRTGSDRLEVVHTFPPGHIRHIHGLYFDRFTDGVYCLTGDADTECRIIRSFDGFASTETVGMGDESWRAVSILFSEKHLYFGTDAEHRGNELFSLDRESRQRAQIGKVSGTVFYSERVGPDMFFTTTAENAPSQTKNVAGLWNVDSTGQLNRIAVFEKDRWDVRLFMFGTIHFPFENRFDDRLYFSLLGVEGDNSTYCLRRYGQ